MVIIGGVEDRAYVDHDGVDLINAVMAVPFLQPNRDIDRCMLVHFLGLLPAAPFAALRFRPCVPAYSQ